MKKPRYVQGYLDMGTCLSRFVKEVPWGLTDRDDGTVYYVTASTGEERVALNTQQPAGGPVVAKVFPAGEEPFLKDLNVRIFVRGGRLGYEPVTDYIYGGPRWLLLSVADPFTVRYELTRVDTTGVLVYETAPSV